MRNKGHFLDLRVNLYSFIYYNCYSEFFTVAVKWPKTLVLAVMPTSPPRPSVLYGEAPPPRPGLKPSPLIYLALSQVVHLPSRTVELAVLHGSGTTCLTKVELTAIFLVRRGSSTTSETGLSFFQNTL